VFLSVSRFVVSFLVLLFRSCKKFPSSFLWIFLLFASRTLFVHHHQRNQSHLCSRAFPRPWTAYIGLSRLSPPPTSLVCEGGAHATSLTPSPPLPSLLAAFPINFDDSNKKVRDSSPSLSLSLSSSSSSSFFRRRHRDNNKKRRIERRETIWGKILKNLAHCSTLILRSRSFTWAAKSMLRGHVAFLRGHARSVDGRADVRVVLLHALPYELRGALDVCFHHFCIWFLFDDARVCNEVFCRRRLNTRNRLREREEREDCVLKRKESKRREKKIDKKKEKKLSKKSSFLVLHYWTESKTLSLLLKRTRESSLATRRREFDFYWVLIPGFERRSCFERTINKELHRDRRRRRIKRKLIIKENVWIHASVVFRRPELGAMRTRVLHARVY